MMRTNWTFGFQTRSTVGYFNCLRVELERTPIPRSDKKHNQQLLSLTVIVQVQALQRLRHEGVRQEQELCEPQMRRALRLRVSLIL